MVLEILRREHRDAAPRLVRYEYTPSEAAETVATALTRLNETLADPIRWECSCLQKKCGACAMVINGKPMLACDARLPEKDGTVRVEPLRKFPVIADLVVDRSALFENLALLHSWLTTEAEQTENTVDTGYAASRCLQCGCCLEVCPNFMPGGIFAGMAGAVPMTRLLAQTPPKERKDLAERYRKRVYEGCGKSLACRRACPAEIDAEAMLVNSNAAAVWKLLFRRKII